MTLFDSGDIKINAMKILIGKYDLLNETTRENKTTKCVTCTAGGQGKASSHTVHT